MTEQEFAAIIKSHMDGFDFHSYHDTDFEDKPISAVLYVDGEIDLTPLLVELKEKLSND